MNNGESETNAVVAKRVFCKPDGGVVTAIIYKPVEKDVEQWTCRFDIHGLSREVSTSAYGVDGVQAMIVALDGIRAHLESSGETLTFLDGEPGDYGISRRIPEGFGLQFEKQLEQLMADEVAKLVAGRRKE